jgi:hypothetical protein
MQAFVEFKETGSKLFRINYHAERHACWGDACAALVFMLAAADLYPNSTHNFRLQKKHIESLRDMLGLADWLQSECIKGNTKLQSNEAKELCKKFFAALSIFRQTLDVLENLN